MISKINFTSVEDQEPPKNGTTILAMHYRDGVVYWIASIWYYDTYNVWMCEFTDDEFIDMGHHSLTHWTINCN